MIWLRWHVGIARALQSFLVIMCGLSRDQGKRIKSLAQGLKKAPSRPEFEAVAEVQGGGGGEEKGAEVGGGGGGGGGAFVGVGIATVAFLFISSILDLYASFSSLASRRPSLYIS